MKWIGLAILLAAISPFSAWLRRHQSEVPKAWVLLGLFPFLLTVLHFNIAPISWVDWPGYVKGAELTVLDAYAVALYLSIPGGWRRPPFRFAMLFYFLATLLSAVQAEVPTAAFFYSWQLARMFLVYAVVARACAYDVRVAPAILSGMAFGLIFEASLTIWQRFGLGLVQTPGTFGHQNLLGLLSHLIVFPFFALLLAGPRGWLPIAAVLSGVVVEVMTASRATIGLAGLGFGLLFMLSALRQWTPRKAVVLAVGVVAISVLVPIALLSLGQRFAGGAAPEADYDERAAFETAASMMLSDHAFGVGPNNYVMAANVGGYNQAAGVASTEGSEGANVHNIYWLTAAETGYLGVLTFVLLLARPLILAFSCGWRHRWDQRGDLLLGLGVGLLIVYIHSKFEWSLAVAEAQYMIVITMGLVAGIAQQINSSQPIGYAPHKTPVMHGFAGRR